MGGFGAGIDLEENPMKKFGRYFASLDIVESCKKYRNHFVTSKIGDAIYGITSGAIRYGSFFLMYDGLKYAINNPKDSLSSIIEAGIGVMVAVDSANRFRRKECMINELDEYKAETVGLVNILVKEAKNKNNKPKGKK